ncbi:MAG: hypothetical protein J6U31_02005, partial [Bacteroidales bacterium]|nr:hypothetical protein [Bacteroidales bacterium]
KKTPNRGTDYVYKAYICEMKGMPDDADICLDSAELTHTTLSDQVFLCEGKSRILEHRKDYEGALHFMKMRIEKQNSIIYSIYGQSVSAAQRDFLLQQKERVEHRGEMHRLYLTFGLILLIILLTAIILFSYYKQKESCRKIEEYLEDVSVLTHTLTVKDSRIRLLERELSEKSDKQQSRQLEMQAKVQKLFAGQFAFIDSICSDMQNNKFDQKQVYERLQNEIQKLASDEQNQSQLEAVIDEYFNDIMKRVKATGIINGNGAQLLSYMIARFRNRSIMMLMNIDDLATLKKRKTRLRERLQRSGLAEAEEALSYLSASDE